MAHRGGPGRDEVELVSIDTPLLVVGAGPQALTLLTYARRYAMPDLDAVVVADPHEWLSASRARFAAHEIPMLRSACVHHPHPDPYALLDFGRGAAPRDFHGSCSGRGPRCSTGSATCYSNAASIGTAGRRPCGAWCPAGTASRSASATAPPSPRPAWWWPPTRSGRCCRSGPWPRGCAGAVRCPTRGGCASATATTSCWPATCVPATGCWWSAVG